VKKLFKTEKQKGSKSILIISQLDMQKAGNQLLYQMIRGYAVSGYRVIFLTSNPAFDSNRADYHELLGSLMAKVSIYRFIPLFRPFAKLIFQVKKILLSHNPICPKSSLTNVADTVPFGTSGGRDVLGLLSWISFILGGIFKAIQLARLYKIKVVYGYEIYGAPIAWIVAKMLRIPLITKFQGTIAFPELERGRAWYKIPHHLLALKTSADLVIMENDGTRGKEVLLRLGVPEEKIRFWIDGVNKEMYIPRFEKNILLRKVGLNDNSKIILTVSRLEKWKRVDRSVMAMAQVIKKIPNAFLLVVGDGKERKNLEQLAQILEVRDHVLFEGAVPYDKVKYYLNMCDIFLSLYDHSNLCNPVLEALECGKCIITINDGSTKAILKDGYNAILVPKGKLEQDLPNVLVKVLKDDTLRNYIGRNAKIYAEKHLLSWAEREAIEVKEIERLLKKNIKEE